MTRGGSGARTGSPVLPSCRVARVVRTQAESGVRTTGATPDNGCNGAGTERASGQDAGQVVLDRDVELVVGARPRVPVGPPATEVRGVPEPVALHLVVRDLDDELRPQRHERQVLAGVPAGDVAGHPPVDVRLRVRPVAPRVPRL